MTHTPRPWAVGTGTTGYNVCSQLADTDPSSVIAENINKYEDALLIAAAPDLLAALEEAALRIEHLTSDADDDPTLKRARAAIAQARETK